MSGEHDTAPTLDHDGYDSDGIYRGNDDMTKRAPAAELHTAEMPKRFPPESPTLPDIEAEVAGHWHGSAAGRVRELETRLGAEVAENARLRGVLRVCMSVIERVYQARHEVEQARDVVAKALG